MKDIIPTTQPARGLSALDFRSVRPAWIGAGVLALAAIVTIAVLAGRTSHAAGPTAVRVPRELQGPQSAEGLSLALVKDRAAQASLRNAYVAEKVHFTDTGAFTTDVTVLKVVDPSLDYSIQATPAPGVNRVSVFLSNGALYLSARSASGKCFYLQELAFVTGYASDAGCGAAIAQRYSAAPWGAGF